MTLQEIQTKYETYKNMGLQLNMQRGQPSDANFDLSNPMLTIVNEDTLETPSSIAIRNYPGGIPGLPEARALLATIIGVKPAEIIVGNNSSLHLLSNILMWAMLKGLLPSPTPWGQQSPKMIITVPGYDRHFTFLATLGIEMVAVNMTPEGPNIEAIEQLVAEDAAIKGMVFVPTYSNPTGDTISDKVVQRLAQMKTAAPDFTIFADDAYAVHHLTDERKQPLNLLRACEDAGNPNRVYIFGSTSKITFASAGLGFFGTSQANVAYISKLTGTQFIGPNKIEQYRHVRFLQTYPGGITGLMRQHARLLKPKFDAVQEVLTRELGGTGLATWSNPQGGYFVSLDTTKPVADRVVALAKEAGVALTPAGATYPHGRDPNNSNIRLAPTRPPVAEVAQAMEVVATCIKLASAQV